MLDFPKKQKRLLFSEEITDMKAGVQAAQVTVGVSDAAHKLPMASVIRQPPQLDPRG